MTTIEELVGRFEGLPPASSGRWSVVPLVEQRIYLSRDELGRFAIFVVGEETSFGTYPKLLSITHSSAITPVPGGVPFAALRLTSSNSAHGNRIMAHIAYELERRLASDGSVGNATLIAEVSWILELLADQESILSEEEQIGLVGELVLLRRLLSLTKELELPPSEALARWWGHDRAKRDFAAKGIAVEVKTTSKPIREHYVRSLGQLDPQGAEEVFVYSLGVRRDPTAPRKLTAFIEDAAALITRTDGTPDEDALAHFHKALLAYGYERANEKLYAAGPGFMNFHLQPRLFRERDLDRVRLSSFKNDRLPSMVNEIMYLLELRSAELSVQDERVVLALLLQSAATSG